MIDFGKKEDLFRKYCGRAIIVIENSEKNVKLFVKYEKLASPAHLLKENFDWMPTKAGRRCECENTFIAGLTVHCDNCGGGA